MPWMKVCSTRNKRSRVDGTGTAWKGDRLQLTAGSGVAVFAAGLAGALVAMAGSGGRAQGARTMPLTLQHHSPVAGLSEAEGERACQVSWKVYRDFPHRGGQRENDATNTLVRIPFRWPEGARGDQLPGCFFVNGWKARRKPVP